MNSKIDFERVITDPAYRRQTIARLNGGAGQDGRATESAIDGEKASPPASLGSGSSTS